MELTIKKRFLLVYNLIFFLCLSLILTYISLSIKSGRTAFSFETFNSNRPIFLVLIGLLLVSIVSVYRLAKRSLYWVVLFLCFIFFFNALHEYGWTSKISLITCSILLIASFPLVTRWMSEVASPYLNPLYSNLDLAIHKTVPVTVKVYADENKQVLIGEGFLTNWSQVGCFIRLKLPLTSLHKKYQLSFSFAEKDFIENASVISVSKDKLGIGLCFDYNKEQGLGWDDLYHLLHSLGLLPEYVS